MHAHAVVARGCIGAARLSGGVEQHRRSPASRPAAAPGPCGVASPDRMCLFAAAPCNSSGRRARGLRVRVAADDTASPSGSWDDFGADEVQDEVEEEASQFGEEGHSGLAFVLEAAEAVAQETEEEKVEDRRRRYLEQGTLEKDPEKDETALPMGEASERRPYLARIVAAHERADPGAAVEAVEDLKALGLRPGPKAYHGVVVSHVSAGDTTGALDWLLAALEAGEVPLPQTFVALSRAYIREDNIPRAEQMVKAMAKTGFSKQNAWIVLVANLLQEGYMREGESHMRKGLKAGFKPTLDLYRVWIEALCRKGRMTEALKIVPDIHGTTGKLPTADHYAPIIEALTAIDATEAAFRTLVGMFQRSGDTIPPNNRCFNALLRGLSKIESKDPEDAARILEVQGMMNQFGISPDFETAAFCTEGLINAGAFGIAYTTYEDLRKVAEEGDDEDFKASVRLHEDGLMTKMMDGLAEPKSVDYLVECAKGAAQDGCHLGRLEPDSDDRTFVTRWFKESMRFRAEAMEREMWISHKRHGKGGSSDADEWTLVPGLKAASKMTVGELRDELEGYGLPSEGLRKEVYDRLQAARLERKIKPQPKPRAGKTKQVTRPGTPKEESEAGNLVSSRYVAGRRVKVVEAAAKGVKVKLGPSQSTIMSGRAATEMLASTEEAEVVADEEEDGAEQGEGGERPTELELPEWMESEEDALANRIKELEQVATLVGAVRGAGGVLSAQDCQTLIDAQRDVEPGPVRAALARELVGAVRDAADTLIQDAAARGMSTSAGASLYNRAIQAALEMRDAELCLQYAEDMEAAGIEPDPDAMAHVMELQNA